MPKYVVKDGVTIGRGDIPAQQKRAGDVIELDEQTAAAYIKKGFVAPYKEPKIESKPVKPKSAPAKRAKPKSAPKSVKSEDS